MSSNAAENVSGHWKLNFTNIEWEGEVDSAQYMIIDFIGQKKIEIDLHGEKERKVAEEEESEKTKQSKKDTEKRSSDNNETNEQQKTPKASDKSIGETFGSDKGNLNYNISLPYYIQPRNNTSISLTFTNSSKSSNVKSQSVGPHIELALPSHDQEEVLHLPILDTDKNKIGTITLLSNWKGKNYVRVEEKDPFLNFTTIILLLLWALSQVIYIPVVPNTLITTMCILYIGCHGSLNLRDHHTAFMLEGGELYGGEGPETMTAEDAYKFPIVGSFTLGGLYLAFKYFDKDTINKILGAYFLLICTGVVFTSMEPLFGYFINGNKNTIDWVKIASVQKEMEEKKNKKMEVKPSTPEEKFPFTVYSFHIATNLPLFGGEMEILFTWLDVVRFVVSIALSVAYFYTKYWGLSNIFGIAFSLQGIYNLSLGQYKIGCILLSGLFFYDIFWVFATPVMVTVAKSFDGPIKLLFPRSDPLKFFAEGAAKDMSLLGLGDIVIPGIFLALLLRFDAERANIVPNNGINVKFPKPYFYTTFIAYFFGLATTIAVMYYFKAAQPALLYLVPACLLSSFGVALIKGEVKTLFNYTESDDFSSVESEEKKEK